MRIAIIGSAHPLRGGLAELLGMKPEDIEPYPSHVAAESLKLMSAPRGRRYRTVLYWRPLVSGLNDSPEHLDRGRAVRRDGSAQDRAGDAGKARPFHLRRQRLLVPQDLVRRGLRP